MKLLYAIGLVCASCSVLSRAAIGTSVSESGDVRRVRIDVVRYSGNNCARVLTNGQIALDTCHGWSIDDCPFVMILTGKGVRLDTGRAIFSSTHPQRMSDLREELDRAIFAKYGKEYSVLQRSFDHARCVPEGAALYVSGSVIKNNTEGSATAFSGQIIATKEGRLRINLN